MSESGFRIRGYYFPGSEFGSGLENHGSGSRMDGGVIYQSICLSIYIYTHPSIYPSTYPSIYLSIYLSIHPYLSLHFIYKTGLVGVDEAVGGNELGGQLDGLVGRAPPTGVSEHVRPGIIICAFSGR